MSKHQQFHRPSSRPVSTPSSSTPFTPTSHHVQSTSTSHPQPPPPANPQNPAQTAPAPPPARPTKPKRIQPTLPTPHSGKSQDAALASAILKNVNYRNDTEGREEDAEGIAERMGRQDDQNKGKDMGRKRRRNVGDHHTSASSSAGEANCSICRNQTITISEGYRTKLVFPPYKGIEGEMWIVSKEHGSKVISVGEDEWDEIRNFFKCLLRMWDSQDMGVCFMETAIGGNTHAKIVALPVPSYIYNDLYTLFRESLMMESDEWGSHKVIDTRSKGFRNSLVDQVSYFHVYTDTKGGIGHVIENVERNHRHRGGKRGMGMEDLEDDGAIQVGENKGFSPDFGREVIASVCDMEPGWTSTRWCSSSENKKRLEDVSKPWGKFDWTKGLVQTA